MDSLSISPDSLYKLVNLLKEGVTVTIGPSKNTFLRDILLVLGPIIGMLAVLAGIWLKERLERKHQIREWFYETYISNGIAEILLYIDNFIDKILFPKQIKIEEYMFPTKALFKVNQLLGSYDSTRCFRVIYFALCDENRSIFADEEKKENYKQLYKDFRSQLNTLYELCSKIKIKEKKDVELIRTRTEIKKIQDKVNAISKKFEQLTKS